MGVSDWLEQWDDVVATADSAAIEEAWLARLEAGPGDGVEMIEALRRLRKAGKKTVAASLLELAAVEARQGGAWQACKLFLVELLRLGIGNAEESRAGLEVCVRNLWAGRPSLERLLAQFPLKTANKAAEALAVLEAWLEFDIGGVFAMSGRGAGRVVEANYQLGMLRLDFAREKKVPVPIGAASKYLTPLPVGHFLRRRLEEEGALRAEVQADPQGAMQTLLECFGTAMSVTELKAALAGLVSEEQWTSWWNRAKKHPSLLAIGSGVKVHYRMATAGGASAEIRGQFEAAGLAERLELARRHGGRDRELGAFMAAELLAAAGAAADPHQAWEALQLAGRLSGEAAAVEAVEDAVIARFGPLALLAALGDPAQRELVLDLVRRDLPERHVETTAAWLERETHPRVLTRLAADLVAAGESARVVAFLDQVFLHPQRHPAALVWALEDADERLAAILDERRGGPLLVRLVELAERRELAPLRPRLKEILSPRGLAGRIVLERLAPEQGRRLLQILEKQGELGEERAWLRRAVVGRYPELREEKKDESVPALQATVLRLQAELKDLLEKKIPETLKAIQIARAEGDLRENFEYHAQRAKQELLSARASELQGDLARVKVIDPARVDPSRVRVGTRVTLTGEAGERVLTILGPYEADAEAGIVSHASEAGQALIERAVGDRITLAGAVYTVVDIAATS